MIEGTITATLLERANPGAIASRRESAGKLYNVSEFAAEVAQAAVDPIPDGQHPTDRRHELVRGGVSVRAADIEKLVSVGRPDIAPDGSFAVFASSRPDLAANRAVGQVWRVDLPDGIPRRLTRGTADSSPRLSPDGSRIAFVRGDAKGKGQIHVVAAGGGEPVQVTDAPLGVDGFDWSGDGVSLAFTARIPEAGRYGSVEGLDAAAEAPRRITGIRWHANGLGYIADRPAQLFVVAAPAVDDEPFYEPAAAVLPEGEQPPKKQLVANEARALTSGAASHAGVVFDGDEVLTVVDEIEHDRRDLRSRLVAVRTDGSGERELLGRSSNLSISDVVVADDGAVAILAADAGPAGIDFVAPGVALWLLEEAGPRTAHRPRDDRPRRGRQPHHGDRRRLPRAGPHARPRPTAAGHTHRRRRRGARR